MVDRGRQENVKVDGSERPEGESSPPQRMAEVPEEKFERPTGCAGERRESPPTLAGKEPSPERRWDARGYLQVYVPGTYESNHIAGPGMTITP